MSSLSISKAVAPPEEPFATSHGALIVTSEPSEETESREISPTFVMFLSPRSRVPAIVVVEAAPAPIVTST